MSGETIPTEGATENNSVTLTLGCDQENGGMQVNMDVLLVAQLLTIISGSDLQCIPITLNLSRPLLSELPPMEECGKTL